MDRRTFLITAAAASALPQIGAASALEYSPGLLKERLNAGETVFLDFKASWCGTCRAQGRVINALKEANPAYEQNITFIDVDWDTYGKAQITQSMRIPRRSTLVVLKGDDELGRIVAETRESRIKELLDTALSAATSA